MTVKGKSATLALENILVGDVWILGGQSNMEFPISKVVDGELEANPRSWLIAPQWSSRPWSFFITDWSGLEPPLFGFPFMWSKWVWRNGVDAVRPASRMPVIARVNRPENIGRIHVAGVDFALSISQVTGQILARKLLGKAAVSLDQGLEVSLVSSPELVDMHPAGLRIRERTGCSVVAVERGGDVLVRFDSDFRFSPQDSIYICGSETAIRKFAAEFPPA